MTQNVFKNFYIKIENISRHLDYKEKYITINKNAPGKYRSANFDMANSR